MANKSFKRTRGAIDTIIGEPKPKPRDGGRADSLRPVPRINYDLVTEDDILNNQFIRLNTIYKIVDKNGKLVDFKMNIEQYDFFRNMHNLNIVLKPRQRGFTTIIQLFLLDIALFTPNTSCGVIAHNKDDAQKFFDKKIRLAYENIPPDFKKKHVPTAEQDREGQLKFSNGSYISVGTSMRSDTLQYLHISEFGKLCAKFPEKAAEVVSGALNTVSVGNWIAIESTGEGAYGHFYDMCTVAREKANNNEELSEMDYKFFFYPWWTAREYRLAVYQQPTPEDEKYFSELERFSGIVLDRAQKNWYILKRKEQKERMWREYPSTPDESFRGIIDGAPLSRIMSNLRRQGHVCRVPWSRAHPVHTFWDLGRNDMMAIWFMQHIGFEKRWIDYHEDNFLPLSHYATVLLDRPYVYGTHHLPHDADVVELSRTDAKSRKEILEDLLPGDFVVIDRIASEEEGVNMTRENMDDCYFDEVKCEQGLKCLENVRYRWDEKLQAFQPNLLRTWAKHGYDAFAQYGHGYRHRAGTSVNTKSSQSELSRENRGGSASSRRRKANRLHENTDWRV